MPEARRQSKSFLARDADGRVRLRMRFTGEEASLFEEAAGDVPIMLWIHRTLKAEAQRQVRKKRARLKVVPPPE